MSQADVQALGNLACDLPGSFVADSAEALLPWLAGCPEPLDQDQEEAARMALQGGGRPYGYVGVSGTLRVCSGWCICGQPVRTFTAVLGGPGSAVPYCTLSMAVLFTASIRGQCLTLALSPALPAFGGP